MSLHDLECRDVADERAPSDELSMVRPVQAFRLLGIGRTLGYKLLRNGTLPKVRIGGRAVGIPLAAIRELIEGGMTTPHPEPTPEPPQPTPKLEPPTPRRTITRPRGQRP